MEIETDQEANNTRELEDPGAPEERLTSPPERRIRRRNSVPTMTCEFPDCNWTTSALADPFSAQKRHLAQDHGFGHALGAPPWNPENSALLKTIAYRASYRICCSHRVWSRKNSNTVKYQEDGGTRNCEEATCDLSEKLPEPTPPTMRVAANSRRVATTQATLPFDIPFEELMKLQALAGTLSKFAKSGLVLQLERKVYIEVLSELKANDEMGVDTDIPLKKLEFLKTITHENVRNFQSKAAWLTEMRRRLQLMLDDKWEELQPVQVLRDMSESHLQALRERERTTTAANSDHHILRRKYHRAVAMLKAGRIGDAYKVYQRAAVEVMTEENDPYWKEKTTLLFPEAQAGDELSPDHRARMTATLEEALGKYLTTGAFLTKVRKAKLLRMVGADRWCIDLMKPLFHTHADGLHTQLGDLFVHYLKMLYMRRVPEAYLRFMVLHRLVLTISKSKQHATTHWGLQLRPIQPYSHLLKIVESIMLESQDEPLKEYLAILQLGVKQPGGSAIVVMRMKEAFAKKQAIFTSDEHQGYVSVHIAKSRDRLQPLPEMQAFASAHAEIPSLVTATNGAVVSNASASLPQGGTAAPVYYSAARQGGITEANQVVTGGPKMTGSGVFAYIDNLYCHHDDTMTALRGFKNYEQYLQAEGSKFNSTDSYALLPLMSEEICRELQEISSSFPPNQLLFHPEQRGVTIRDTPQNSDRGLKVMGVPVGTKEYQRLFMRALFDDFREDNKTLSEVARVNTQHFLLFLRNCRWHQKVGYWGRLVHPEIMEPLVTEYMNDLYAKLEAVIGPLSPFHRLWLGRKLNSNGMGLFNLNTFNLCGYIAQRAEYQAYKVLCDAETDILEGPGLESVLACVDRYVIEAGGWDKLPAEWQDDRTPKALYSFLIKARLDDPHLSLQEVLHEHIHTQMNALCEEMLNDQPRPVQVIYRVTQNEDLAGRMVLLALPKTPNTTFTSAEMLTLVCNKFALPLPGLDPDHPAPCPGCATPLDCHGSHLLNCRKVSTKGAINQYNRQLAHNQLATELSKIMSDKFYHVRTDPKGDANCPILADGSRGRLDIIHVPRDNGPTILSDVSITNPLTAAVLNSTTIRSYDAMEHTRIQKRTKYLEPLRRLATERKLLVLPFHIYGGVGTEVLALLEEIAEYIGETREINVAGLLRYYRREIACASQKVAAKLLVARLDLVRARSNQHRYHWTNNVGMANYIQEEGNDERQYGA